jgi:tetratricopeptide (TPR) repeat protein
VELKNTLSLPPFVLAMCLYMDYVETKSVRCYLWAFALFVVAMLCKISMAPFPFIILLYVWWKKGEITWPDVKAAIPFFLISLALSLTTIWCGKVYSHPVENWDPGDHAVGGPLFRFILSGQIIAFYFSRFFLPINPVPIYAKWPVDPSQWINYFYWPVILVVLGFLWTKRRSWGRDALLGVGFFLISLLPFIGFNSISYMNATWILDHVLYIPMIGLIGLAVAACGKINALLPASTRPFSISILCVILALLTFQSHFYASQFLSEETITRYNLRFANSIDLHNNLGIALQDRGAYGEAIQQFQLALADEPHGGKAQFNMGTVLVKMGQMNDAIAAYEKSVDDAPEQGAARAGLADTLFQVGRTDEAMKQYQEAIRLNFKVAMMTGRVGECLFIEGRRDEALKQFKAAVEADPDLPLAQYNLAKALCQMGQVDEGIKHYRQAIQLLPNYAEAHNNLGIALFGQGHTDAALEEFRQAVQDDPNYSDARNNLELAEKGAATSR